jgi:PHS family inorganic phosphate transporter-like MFS transporter
LAAGIVALIAIVALKNSVLADNPAYYVSVDQFWRIVIGMGMVPAVIALYFRLTIPETPRYTMDVERNITQGANDANQYLATGTFNKDPDAAVVERAEMPKASWKDFCHHFGQWKNGKVLFGTAFSWFALDVSFLVPRHQPR